MYHKNAVNALYEAFGRARSPSDRHQVSFVIAWWLQDGDRNILIHGYLEMLSDTAGIPCCNGRNSTVRRPDGSSSNINADNLDTIYETSIVERIVRGEYWWVFATSRRGDGEMAKKCHGARFGHQRHFGYVCCIPQWQF